MGCFLEGQEFLCNIKAKGLEKSLLLCRGSKIICIFCSYFENGYLLGMNELQMVGTAFGVDRNISLLRPASF